MTKSHRLRKRSEKSPSRSKDKSGCGVLKTSIAQEMVAKVKEEKRGPRRSRSGRSFVKIEQKDVGLTH